MFHEFCSSSNDIKITCTLFNCSIYLYLELGADYFDCMRHCIQIGSLNWCVLVNMVSASIMRNCYFLNSV